MRMCIVKQEHVHDRVRENFFEESERSERRRIHSLKQKIDFYRDTRRDYYKTHTLRQ